MVVIDVASGPVNVFTPDEALGAAVDGLAAGEVDRLFTAHNVRALGGVSLRPLSYSLRTELAIEAWHWGQEGRWSDAVHRQGYWISSDHPRRPVLTGWGYGLPRRGDSVDQANDDGYSRLDDGSASTFWKSNPYLDQSYTHAPARPQWVVVAFDSPRAISAARIRWARPFARRFRVQHWSGVDPFDRQGGWVDFPGGSITNGRGGHGVLTLVATPLTARYLRILLEVSSNTAPKGSVDPRDAMGFAISEVGFGVVDDAGRFLDAVRHTPSGADQTAITVSSTDPWHRASDRDPDTEQPGFDRVFASGLTHGLPVMIPVGALYDTPENAAAEVRFLKRRGYPLRQVEVGMEPDGQKVSPEDFAALYVQFAAAVRAADGPAGKATLSLGGPSLQDAVSDTWLDADFDHSWTRRFLVALTARGRAKDLGFFAFEYYPVDALCGPLDKALMAEDARLGAGIARLRADGVPAAVPLVITEYGFSAFSAQGEVELPGALFNADMIAHFLSLGGRATYLLGYGPSRLFEPETPCAGYGELMLFGGDPDGQAQWPTPAYWGARMMTTAWVQSGGLRHALYKAAVDGPSGVAVAAYPLARADGRWAILLINRDPAHAQSVQFALTRGGDRLARGLRGPFEVLQYGADQYVWRPDGAAGRPTRNDPPRAFSQAGDRILLPPYSLTVVRTTAAQASVM